MEKFTKVEEAKLAQLESNTHFSKDEIEWSYSYYKANKGVGHTEKFNLDFFSKFIDFSLYSGREKLPKNSFEFETAYAKLIDFIKQQDIDRNALDEKLDPLRVEVYKATIGFANAAIKALLIGNGGALAAYFTFYQTAISNNNSKIITPTTPAAGYFIIGAFTAIAVPILAYIVTSNTEVSLAALQKKEKFFNLERITLGFGLISLFCFGIGLVALYCAMVNFKSVLNVLTIF